MESASSSNPAIPAHLYGCPRCLRDFLVPSSDPDLLLLRVTMPCPTPDCDVVMQVGVGSSTGTPRYVSARELFNACSGLGFSPERSVGPAHLNAALVNSTVVSVDIDKEKSTDSRSVISSLVVERCGQRSRIHLATSRYGAVAYRITDE